MSTTEYARSKRSALDTDTEHIAIRIEPDEVPPPRDARWVRLSVNLDPVVLEALKELARRNGTTVTEMVRRAISDEKYFQDAADRGAQILIKEDGREIREVIFR